LANLPANFAGDATLRAKNRVFGVLAGDTPQYQEAADRLDAVLGSCGVKDTRRIAYSENPGLMAQQAPSALAQMRAADVSTVVCICDPIAPIFFTQAADQQAYGPEWYAVGWSDNLARNASADQWSHSISNVGLFPQASKTEAYRAYKAANPTGEPVSAYYVWIYWNLLTVFNGIQAAGPHLTPQTFHQGFSSLPPSAKGGDFAPWTYGPSWFTPIHDFQVGWWDPGAKSNFDGGAGAYRNCNAGTWYRFDRPNDLGPAKTQLSCFTG